MKVRDLVQGDEVLFSVEGVEGVEELVDTGEEFHVGNVILVDERNKKVVMGWSKGFQSVSEGVPFENMVAKFDKRGEYMSFGEWEGFSILIKEL